jgi:hypothetical protein
VTSQYNILTCNLWSTNLYLVVIQNIWKLFSRQYFARPADKWIHCRVSLISHLLGNKCKYSVNADTSHSACEIFDIFLRCMYILYLSLVDGLVWFGFMVFNATFNNISVISWRSALLVEETGENDIMVYTSPWYLLWMVLLNFNITEIRLVQW